MEYLITLFCSDVNITRPQTLWWNKRRRFAVSPFDYFSMVNTIQLCCCDPLAEGNLLLSVVLIFCVGQMTSDRYSPNKFTIWPLLASLKRLAHKVSGWDNYLARPTWWLRDSLTAKVGTITGTLTSAHRGLFTGRLPMRTGIFLSSKGWAAPFSFMKTMWAKPKFQRLLCHCRSDRPKC